MSPSVESMVVPPSVRSVPPRATVMWNAPLAGISSLRSQSVRESRPPDWTVRLPATASAAPVLETSSDAVMTQSPLAGGSGEATAVMASAVIASAASASRATAVGASGPRAGYSVLARASPPFPWARAGNNPSGGLGPLVRGERRAVPQISPPHGWYHGGKLDKAPQG